MVWLKDHVVRPQRGFIETNRYLIDAHRHSEGELPSCQCKLTCRTCRFGSRVAFTQALNDSRVGFERMLTDSVYSEEMRGRVRGAQHGVALLTAGQVAQHEVGAISRVE